MRIILAGLAAATMIAGGCAPRADPAANLANSLDATRAATPARGSTGWAVEASGEGSALVFGNGAATIVRLFCPAATDRLLVNVPGFRPIGSEERLSLGSGAAAVALVADPRGDPARGGVSGSGAIPPDLKALVGGPVSVSYGAQTSGPHPAPPAEMARPFVTACFDGAAASGIAASRPTAATSPCLQQDGELLRISPLRAVGTEPFWGARVAGRCVTYSTPDDQQGTRVWTRFTSGPDGGVWSGALGGQPFRLITRPQPDCSDGMSDKIYPIEVRVTVGGEERRGCAEPL